MIARFLKYEDIRQASDLAALAFWDEEDQSGLDDLHKMALIDFTASFIDSPYHTWVSTVVDEDGTVLAGAAIRDSFLSSGTYDLSWVFTHPDHRRKGHASTAVNFLIDFIRDDLLEGDHGSIHSSCDADIVSLYTRLGFGAGLGDRDGYMLSYIVAGRAKAA